MAKIRNNAAKYNAVKVYPSIISTPGIDGVAKRFLYISVWSQFLEVTAPELKNMLRRKRLKLICILVTPAGDKHFKPVKNQTVNSYRQ